MGGYNNGGLSVWRTTTAGSSWSKWKLLDASGGVYDIAVHPTDANTVLAAGHWRDTDYNHFPILSRTTNGGTNWNEITTISYPADTEDANCVIFDPFNPQNILLGTDRGVIRSTDGGTTWTTTSSSYDADHLIADPGLENSMFASSSWNGMFESTDGGQTWSPMNDGLSNKYINYIDIDPVNRYLYAATDYGGIFRYTLGASPVEEIDSELPDRFVLHPNYPNPFNATTEIQYELSRHGHVTLTVYDIRGRVIQTLVDGYMLPGVNCVTWDGRNDAGNDVVSGVYLVRLVADQVTKTQKMVLQR